MVTLNTIHSELWVEPALEILFDEKETPEIRNRATAGLSGFDLSHVNNELWDLFLSFENQFHKANIASLLLNADTAMAYRAFYELYQTQDGHIQRNALQKLVVLRPGESTKWYLNALQGEDWMTANLAMDSLISATNLNPDELELVYNTSVITELVQWRIIYVFGQQNNQEYIPFLCDAMKNKSWLVRTEAAVALSKFPSGSVDAQVKKLLANSSERVQKNVGWILNQTTEK